MAPWSSFLSPVAISLLLSSSCSSTSTTIKWAHLYPFYCCSSNTNAVVSLKTCFSFNFRMQISFFFFHPPAFLFLVLLSSALRNVFIVFLLKEERMIWCFYKSFELLLLPRTTTPSGMGRRGQETTHITRETKPPPLFRYVRLNHFQNIHRFSASLRKMYSTTSNATTSPQE